jgi:hypothetical protein
MRKHFLGFGVLWFWIGAGLGASAYCESGFFIDPAGRIGIGTSNPKEMLDVRDGKLKTNMDLGQDQDHHQMANSSGVVYGKIGLKSSSANVYLGTDTHPNLLLLERSTGNVGVGTPAPQEKLHVNGRLRVENTQIANNEINHTGNGSLLLGSRNTANTILQPNGGRVGVGNSNPKSALDVNGAVSAKELSVSGAASAGSLTVDGAIRAKLIILPDGGGADFVFAEGYRLRPIAEVETFIRENGHLPDVPPAAETASRGVMVAEMLKTQLQKIEELTLYVIGLKKENDALHQRLTAMESRAPTPLHR